MLSCCFTSMEARQPIWDRDRVGRGRQSEGSTGETAWKRPERPWTATRTMEVLRRCPLAIAQWLVYCAIAVSTAVLDRVTKTMSVALLLMNNLDNSMQKRSNQLIPAPPPYSWSLLGKFEGPVSPPSSKISWSFDLAWNLACFIRSGSRFFSSDKWYILFCFAFERFWAQSYIGLPFTAPNSAVSKHGA